jgi:hypothetical protein
LESGGIPEISKSADGEIAAMGNVKPNRLSLNGGHQFTDHHFWTFMGFDDKWGVVWFNYYPQLHRRPARMPEHPALRGEPHAG